MELLLLIILIILLFGGGFGYYRGWGAPRAPGVAYPGWYPVGGFLVIILIVLLIVYLIGPYHRVVL